MSPEPQEERPVLYSYWRSTAAYRARIALNLKGIDYALHAIDLTPGVDEQQGAAYRAVNPAGLVPALAIERSIASGPAPLPAGAFGNAKRIRSNPPPLAPIRYSRSSTGGRPVSA